MRLGRSLVMSGGLFVLACAGACGSESNAGGDSVTDGGPGDGGAGGDASSDGGPPVVKCTTRGEIPLLWAKRVANGGSPSAFAVAKDGSMRLSGSFASEATTPLVFGAGGPKELKLTATLGTSDAWFAKLDADGVPLWAKSAGGTDADHGYAVAAAEDGTTRVAGTFKGTAVFGKGEPGETSVASSGEQAMFVASHASDGAVAWVKQAGGAGIARPVMAFAASDGSLRVVGSLEGTVTFGAGEPGQTMLTSTVANSDFFLARYEPNGALAWAKRVHGVPGARVALAPDGGMILAAVASSALQTTLAIGESNETKLTDSPSFFAKYDGDGKLGVVVLASGPPPTDIAISADGGWTIAGTLYATNTAGILTATFGKGEANETTFTGSLPDFFIARYGADGKLAWAKRATDQVGKERGLKVGVAADGTARALGTYSPSTSPILGAGEPGALKLPSSACSGSLCDIPFLASFAADGSVLAGKRYSAQVPSVVALHAMADGSMRLAGHFIKETTFGEGEPGATTLSGGGIYVARYDFCP